MKLKRIFIKNFLSYKEKQEIIIDDKALIVGENGLGKSNIDRIINFILSQSYSYNFSGDDYAEFYLMFPKIGGNILN